MSHDDETPRSNQVNRRNAGALWLPIGSVAVAIGVVIGAAVTWATDRSELKSNTATNDKQDLTLRDHQTKLDDLTRGAAVRDANDMNLREQLNEIKSKIDKIAERVGAKP